MSGHRITCDACRRPIKATEAALIMHTPTTTETAHIVCLRERAPEAAGEHRKAKAA